MRRLFERSIFLSYTIIVASILTVWFGWLSYTRPSGYCVAESRYLSKDELIASAIRSRAQNIDGLRPDPSASDVDAYRRENPWCCVITNRTKSLADRVSDWFMGPVTEVELLYALKPGSSSHAARFYEASIQVNHCGRAGDFFGIPLTAAEFNSARRKRETG
jgi:hypothetical protein